MLSHNLPAKSTSSPHDPHVPTVPTRAEPPRRVLHRLHEVRQREEVSLRTLGRRLHLSLPEIRNQEEDPDPRLSTLHAWAAALEVPIAELVGEPTPRISERLLWRAKFLQFMKVVRTIEAWSKPQRIQRLASFLAEQMLSLMPELHDVGPLPTLGKIRDPRTSRIEEQRIRAESLDKASEDLRSSS
jgi:transcriptional regulator with XRE-family HTH domain